MTKHTPTDEQAAILGAFAQEKDSMLIEADAGCAKALRADQDVVTALGAKPIGKLSVGDMVFGLDGKLYPVLGVFPQGVKPLFKLLFSDGSSVIATGDHFWKVYRAQGGFKKPMVVDTNFMRKKPRIKTGSYADWGDGTRAYWFLPMCKEVEFETRVKTVDPWLLGFLLGDGCLQNHSVAFSTADQEIVEAVRTIVGADYGLNVKQSSAGSYDYRISSSNAISENGLLLDLQVLGVAGYKSQDKFVPRNYLMGDKETRLAVLQGLFDSDGSADKTRVMYGTASFTLAHNVKFMVESLGGTAVMGEMRTAGMLSFRMQIKLPPGVLPFRLKRKKANYKTGQRPPYRALESVTQIEDGEAVCIAVGSPDKLFLTNNFIPTHNTSTMEMMAHAQARKAPMPALAIAFNKKTAMELQARMPQSFQCKTMNGLGYGAWALAQGGKLNLREYKVGDLIKDVVSDWAEDLKEDEWQIVKDFVNDARNAGIIHQEWETKFEGLLPDTLENWASLSEEAEPQERLLELAREVLKRSTDMAFQREVDFDDMVYCSVLMGGKFKPYPLVMVDEVQDLNTLNIMQVQKVARDRIVAVGDRKQCHPPGTMIQLSHGKSKPIEEVKIGDRLVSYNRKVGFSGLNTQGSKVTDVQSFQFDGELVKIVTDGPFKHECTPNHRCLVKWTDKTGYSLYLMRKGNQFRMGIAQNWYNTKLGGFGPAMRARQEKADALWVLQVFASKEDAMIEEKVAWTRFGLPDLIWKCSGKTSSTQYHLDAAWASIGDNTERALSCLKHYKRDIAYPLYMKGNKIHIGEKRFITEACNLITGAMEVKVFDGSENCQTWLQIWIGHTPYSGRVVGITTESNGYGMHLYVANGIVTHNSIYQFRGANANAIDTLKACRSKWIELPLHVTFRCPQAVVARQQRHAPGYTAAPGNPPGEFHRWVKGDEFEGVIMWNGLRSSGWTWKWLKSLCNPGEKPFVLCRNTAPLLRLAFKLIRDGIVPEMMGRGIGKGLVSLSKKIAPKDSMELDAFGELLERWRREETLKAQKNRREYLVAAINDRAGCLKAVAETTREKDVGGLRKAIAALFRRENGELRLATGHRAKGLEEAVILHLDPWRIPSRYALEAQANGDETQMIQERNLKYVIETRSRRVLIEANVEDFLQEG